MTSVAVLCAALTAFVDVTSVLAVARGILRDCRAAAEMHATAMMIEIRILFLLLFYCCCPLIE